uniref:Uncharacterized protein n=1 Tax=Anopheles culicifacies TaxID=139723 RepID=A0A182LYN3_9DIPT
MSHHNNQSSMNENVEWHLSGNNKIAVVSVGTNTDKEESNEAAMIINISNLEKRLKDMEENFDLKLQQHLQELEEKFNHNVEQIPERTAFGSSTRDDHHHQRIILFENSLRAARVYFPFVSAWPTVVASTTTLAR